MSDDYQSRTEKNKNKHKSNRLFSRKDRQDQTNQGQGEQARRDRSSSTFDKIFYVLIALLFLILVGFIIFIMNYSDDSTENVSEDLVQSETSDSIRDLFSRDRNDEEGGEESGETSGDENQEDTSDEAADEDEDESEEETQGDESIINENPPHDPNHATDYSDGSADRLEIRENVLAVTGIPEGDLIENWIGNDGPGRVEATVTQASTGQQYVVYLQYGEGEWHVESVNPQ